MQHVVLIMERTALGESTHEGVVDVSCRVGEPDSCCIEDKDAIRGHDSLQLLPELEREDVPGYSTAGETIVNDEIVEWFLCGWLLSATFGKPLTSIFEEDTVRARIGQTKVSASSVVNGGIDLNDAQVNAMSHECST